MSGLKNSRKAVGKARWFGACGGGEAAVEWSGMRGARIEVVGVGIACLDHAISVDRFGRDERTHVLAYRPSGGGMAATAMVAAQRLGARCALASVVGDDEAGRFVREELRGEGVDVRYVVVREGQETFVAFCLAEAGSGRKMILGCPRRLAAMDPADVDGRFWRMVERCRVLHVDGWHEALAVEAVERAGRAGVLVSFDATAVRGATQRLLGGCDMVFASESFLREFCGKGSWERRLRALQRASPKARWVGVTMGGDGSMALDERGRVIRQRAFGVRVVDTVGAGDAYHGAIAFAVARGWGLERAMRLASAVGALCCTELSGRTGLPSLVKARRFLAGARADE